jgi:hypothetical protein
MISSLEPLIDWPIFLNFTARHQPEGLLSPVSPGWTSPQTMGSPVLFHEHEGIGVRLFQPDWVR